MARMGVERRGRLWYGLMKPAGNRFPDEVAQLLLGDT